MKTIAKNEIFKNLSTFLKGRGIELTEGSYAAGIRQSCSLLTDAINLGQESFEKAKTEFGKTCAQMRQVIHEKTAPKSASPFSASGSAGTAAKRKTKPATAPKRGPKSRKSRKA